MVPALTLDTVQNPIMADDYPVSAYESSNGFDEVKLKLREFLECFPPPQAGRIVDGYSTTLDDNELLDLKTGTVLTFHRQVSPNVPLTFRDPWGAQDSMVRVTLPVEFQGKFKLLPYDPEGGDTSPVHIYHSVEDVIKSFPVYVQANAG